MKKAMLITLVILGLAALAMAQGLQNPTSDVLGAHLMYGRGCAACHAPHSGALGNGVATTDANTGNYALWGQNVAPLFGFTTQTGQMAPEGSGGATSFTLTIPTSWNFSDPVTSDTMTCLSCHDGNLAVGAMMKNKVYEALPAGYGSNPIPTLLGAANGPSPAGDYLNDHPVGDNAIIGCGGSHNWDCTIVNGTVEMTGTNSAQFVQDYGWFVSPAVYNNNPTVQCTTCHNQHLMNVVQVTAQNSGQTPGYYATMFFIRGPYNPASTTSGTDQTAQFCRSCHGGEANEMNGSGALPTKF
jgi:hypothetical protein